MLPYVMAAYRASQHEVTKFTPNYLVLGREVRAPVDLMYVHPPVSYASYAEELDALGCVGLTYWCEKI